jgi:hypothetical protein
VVQFVWTILSPISMRQPLSAAGQIF